MERLVIGFFLGFVYINRIINIFSSGSLMRNEVFVYRKKFGVFNVYRRILLLYLEGIVFYCLFVNIFRIYKFGFMFILYVLDYFENCM